VASKDTEARHYSARFGPDLAAKSTFGASLKPLFRQFQSEVRRIPIPRTSVNKGEGQDRHSYALAPSYLSRLCQHCYVLPGGPSASSCIEKNRRREATLSLNGCEVGRG
jgi:hypothetical protein